MEFPKLIVLFRRISISFVEFRSVSFSSPCFAEGYWTPIPYYIQPLWASLEMYFLNQLKKRGLKRLSVEKKCVPLQADYYQISDKSLIYSALLCLFVSDEVQGCG